jgi:hypothetical protein
MASPRSAELRALAQRVVDTFPADIVEEAAVTGSVSRGVADELSDIELLLVTTDELALEECFALAGGAGLERLATWGPQGGPTRRVFGYLEDVPVELVWWSRVHADAAVDSLLDGEVTGSADAILHALPLRTRGALRRWQERLAVLPPEVAAAQIEAAALTWGGYAPAGILTIARPGETVARLERMLDDTLRVLAIVYALNGVWPPTTKRLVERLEDLRVKPERLARRLDEALLEPEARRALRLLAELQAETVALAPDGPNVLRARKWLAGVLDVLAA